MSKRILVTGGAGYVGSACLRHLLANGFDAIAFDNLVQGHRESVPGGRLIMGDISNTPSLEEALRQHKADAVMHFAAATCVGESVDDPEYHYRNNIAGTLSLLNAMRSAGVKRMLFSSTCATYGLNPKVPMAEDSAQDPCSPYARTKLVVEWMIRDFAHAYGLGFTLLRYFNAAGASPDGQHGEDHNPENHLIPLTLQVPLGQRKKLLVFGNDYPTPDGTCLRDYVHVEDLGQAHRLAIEATSPGTSEVFNIGTGAGSSVLEVIRACEEVAGKPIPFDIVARRPGDPPALVASPQKLISKLGWKPRYTSIKQIVESAWKWHESHPQGYRTPARATVNA
ncbi:MAG TPA: UDP-glucose 4-epimerase GalE [Tepidisphaeraceae bacterium]|jgi:UDP-glucose 4-epimerase|nr:UDP-glucose 4-epimerase GalE [Tepidisphaeraceae bacterium]